MTALALASIPLAFATWLSLYREGLDWDGLFNWASKARIAFLYHGAIPLRYYRAPDDFFHRTYPPLVPVFESWIYGFLGRIDESMIKLIGPYFYLAAALLLISAAYRESRRRWLGILVVLPFLLVPGLLKGDGSAASGYADFPLAAAYLCTVVYVVEFWRNRTLESARLAGVSAMLLPFIKADGAVPLLCVAVAVVPLVIGERRWKAGAWIILPGMAVALGWWAFWKLNGVPRPGDFAAITPAVFLSHLDRAKPLLSWTFEELTTWGRWGLLWPLVAAALGGFFLYTRRSRWYPWFATVGLPLVLYPCAFFFSAWNPVEAHVKSSINRLVLQVAPAAALLVGTALAEFVENAGTSSSGQTGG